MVRGRVQRVNYRASLQQVALALGVTGWVRNRADGTVEAVLQGSPEAVQAVIDWAWVGPRNAQVVDLTKEWISPAAVIAGFNVLD